jgi:acyl dehydratase
VSNRVIRLINAQVAYHVHSEHYTEQLVHPFPTGGTLRTESRVVDVVDRGKGVTVLIGLETYDESGRQVAYNEWTSYIMKVPGVSNERNDF